MKADGENDDIQESEPKDEVDTDESNKTDESDNSDNILTLHGEEEESEDEDEAEKKPTVEELFGAPLRDISASRQKSRRRTPSVRAAPYPACSATQSCSVR